MTRRRGMLYITSALVGVAPPALWMVSSFPARPDLVIPPMVTATADQPQATLAAQAALVARDPMALVRLGQERYAREIHDYRCLLVKQERLGSELTPVQEIELRFRESPRSVYMLWQKNADQAKRALFVDQPAFVDKKGHKTARVEPAGAVIRLFVQDLYVPIDGPEARKSSRRTIDECGFGATFDLLERFNAVAEERGVLNLRSGGVGQVDGRPTYIIVRDLPYAGPDGPYPDARLVLHLDQEWLLPVVVYSYGDHDETVLLGSYVFTKVELNPGFTEDAFRF